MTGVLPKTTTRSDHVQVSKKAVAHGLDQQGCRRIHTHFAHQAGAVTVDGFGTYAQALRDPLIGQPLGQPDQHFAFAWGQCLGLLYVFQHMLHGLVIAFQAASHVINALANQQGIRAFHKNPMCARFLYALQSGTTVRAGQHQNPGLGRPTSAFQQDFNPGRAGHGQIDNGAIRGMRFDQSNCLNPICRAANDFAAPVLFKRGHQPLRCKGVIICNHHGLWQISPKSKATWIVSLLVACVLTFGQARADSPMVAMDGPVSTADLVGHIDHLVDAEWTLTAEQALGARAAEFTPISTKNPDFGYTRDRIWLRVHVRNATLDQRDWVIYFPENFKQYFQVDIAYADGRIDTVLKLTEDSAFGARPIPHPQMLAPMSLDPGAEATVLVSLWSEGSSYITFSMETPASFAALSSRMTAKNFVFYGMMILLIVAALVLLLFLRSGIFLAYSAYAASALLYIAHADGVAFQYLWPDFPALNSKASIFAGTGIIVFGAIYARVFLRTRLLHPVLDKILISVIAVTLSLDAALYFTNPQLLKKALIFLSLIAIITFAVAAVVAAWSNFREVRFYLLAWMGAVASAVMLNLNHLLGVEFGQNFIYDSIRATMVFDACMMGLAILDRFNQMRHSQENAMEAQLQQTQRNLDLSARLTRLSENYEAMTSVARARDEQIQNTVHDLRQPLHALRLKVHGMIDSAGTAGQDTSEVETTFSYLEQLISDYLSGRDSPHGSLIDDAPLDLRQILDSVVQMFAQDAAAKGLALQLIHTDVKTCMEPLAIMRIVSNLVSNAVKYTDSGQVVVEVSKQGTQAQISVSDTGPGLDLGAFERALQRDVRLEDTHSEVPGFGLGLSIAQDLARKHGTQLRLVSKPGMATCISVMLPSAEPA